MVDDELRDLCIRQQQSRLCGTLRQDLLESCHVSLLFLSQL